MTVSACTGACCAAFTLTPIALSRLKADEVNDSAFILDMLVELTPEEVFDRRARLGDWAPGDYSTANAEAYGKWAREWLRHGVAGLHLPPLG